MDDYTPESVDDAVLGRLDWDSSLDWWVGSIELAPGHRVDVFVTHDCDAGRPGDEIARARQSLARIREREPEYRQWSADQLHTKQWSSGQPMTPAEIAELLQVASLELEYGGGVRIFWDDKDRLFWGNNVVTDIGADGECVASGMQ